MYEKKPWLKFYGDVPHTLDYPDLTMYQMVRRAAGRWPHYTAYDFMGTRSDYDRFLKNIDRAADALLARGLKKGDTITVCLPNCPQALILFYALNKIGAVASMIHPLSAPTEIEFYLKESNSIWAVTLDAFYKNFARILDNTNVSTLLLARVGDFLKPLKKLGFFLVSGRKIKKPPKHDKRVLWWNSLFAGSAHKEHRGAPASATGRSGGLCHAQDGAGGKTADLAGADHSAADAQGKHGGVDHDAAGTQGKHGGVHASRAYSLESAADANAGRTPLKPGECAVILYSGGTTGTPKGIMLSSRSFNCLGLQIATQGPL